MEYVLLILDQRCPHNREAYSSHLVDIFRNSIEAENIVVRQARTETENIVVPCIGVGHNIGCSLPPLVELCKL